MIQTNEGALQYEHSLNHFVEFFFKAGSLFTKTQSFYNNNETALSLFQKIWIIDKTLSFKLLLWLRDCRGGAGNRSAFREILTWLCENDPKWVECNIELIPQVGRWDDLKATFKTSVQSIAAQLWANAINNNDILAAKWADRSIIPLQKALRTNEAGLRKKLSAIRKFHIVEHKITFGEFNKIIYSTVPSVAMSRYSNLFIKKDNKRFNEFKSQVKAGLVNINTNVLFPHDCVRTALQGDEETADLQFNNLPNYIDSNNERVIVLADTSGSMDQLVAGSISAKDISIGLALYCSDKIGKNNPFYRKFIGFCSESNFKSWDNMTFSEALSDYDIFDGAVGSTRIDLALDLILNTGLFFNLNTEQMPTALIIISDMQFSVATKENKKSTPVNECLNKWINHGYTPPKIVYWNTAGYAGSPDTVKDNIAMISGFSPAILENLFKGDLNPLTVLLEKVAKYDIKVPTL